MPTVKLPSIQVPDVSLSAKVDYLTDMLVQYKKALEYYVNNLDDANVSSAGFTGAVIKDLGDEYTDEQALAAWVASGYKTYIDANGVYTGTLTALQVNAVAISASSITTGTLSGVNISVDDNIYMGNWIEMQSNNNANGILWEGTRGTHQLRVFGDDALLLQSSEHMAINSPTNIQLNTALVDISADVVVGGDLDINGDLDVGDYVTSDLIPSSNGTYDLGSSTKRWNIYGSSAYLTGTLYCNEVRDSSVTGDPVYVNASAKLGYYSSTIKHKDNVEPYDFDLDKVLALKIVSFNYKKEFNDDQSIQYGIIAEQADELGLDMFVGKDSNGVVKSFAYHKLPIANLNALQCHENRLKAIEKRLGM